MFRELTDSELTALASLMTLRQVRVGTKILEEGGGVSAFSLVCDGVVHVRRLAQKREMLLRRGGANPAIGYKVVSAIMAETSRRLPVRAS